MSFLSGIRRPKSEYAYLLENPEPSEIVPTVVDLQAEIVMQPQLPPAYPRTTSSPAVLTNRTVTPIAPQVSSTSTPAPIAANSYPNLTELQKTTSASSSISLIPNTYGTQFFAPQHHTREEMVRHRLQRHEAHEVLLNQVLGALCGGTTLDFTIGRSFENDLPQDSHHLMKFAVNHLREDGIEFLTRINSPHLKRLGLQIYLQYEEDIAKGLDRKVMLYRLFVLRVARLEKIPKNYLFHFYLTLNDKVIKNPEAHRNLIKELRNSLDLSPEEILAGLTKDELNSITTRNRELVGITKDQIKDAIKRLPKS